MLPAEASSEIPMRQSWRTPPRVCMQLLSSIAERCHHRLAAHSRLRFGSSSGDPTWKARMVAGERALRGDSGPRARQAVTKTLGPSFSRPQRSTSYRCGA